MKATVGFTLPWAGVTPAPNVKTNRHRRGMRAEFILSTRRALLEPFCVIPFCVIPSEAEGPRDFFFHRPFFLSCALRMQCAAHQTIAPHRCPSPYPSPDKRARGR